jgi:hypothetical protein
MMPYIRVNRFTCGNAECVLPATTAVAGPHGLQLYCDAHGAAYAGMATAAGWTIDVLPLLELDQILRDVAKGVSATIHIVVPAAARGLAELHVHQAVEDGWLEPEGSYPDGDHYRVRRP